MRTIALSRYRDVLVTCLAPQRRLVLALCGDTGLREPIEPNGDPDASAVGDRRSAAAGAEPASVEGTRS